MSTGVRQDPTQAALGAAPAALGTASSPAASLLKNTLRTGKSLIVVKAGCSGDVNAGRFAECGQGTPGHALLSGNPRWKGYVPTGPVLIASVMTEL
jgi:hypothetical protein